MKETKSETSIPKYAPPWNPSKVPCAQAAMQNPPTNTLPTNYPRHIALCPGHDAPRTDDVVGVAGEQRLAVGAPRQADALGLAALLADALELGLELVNLALLLKVEDDDAAGRGGAEPVAVGGEDEGMDLVVGVEGVEVLGLVEIPEHGGTVLAAGGAEGTVGGDGDGVDIPGVADVVGLDLAGRELPNLCRRVSTIVKRAGGATDGHGIKGIRACVLVSLPANAGSEVANTFEKVATSL